MASLRRDSLIFMCWQCIRRMCACMYIYVPDLFLFLSLLCDNFGNQHASYSVKPYALHKSVLEGWGPIFSNSKTVYFLIILTDSSSCLKYFVKLETALEANLYCWTIWKRILQISFHVHLCFRLSPDWFSWQGGHSCINR
jgi:hypothetical protein